MGKKKGAGKKKGTAVKKQERAEQKAYERKKKRIAEDRTFGLKNKKKSKKVQKYVKGVKNSAVKPSGRSSELSPAEKKRLQKLEEKARKRELQKYFGKDGYGGDTDKKSVGEVMQEVETEIEDQKELSLEEIIDEERRKVVGGTKVTFESFKKWKTFRDKMKKTKESRLEKIQTNMLSGRELFNQKSSIFKDDDDAETSENLKIDESLFLDDFDEGFADEEVEQTESLEHYIGEFGEEDEYDRMVWGNLEKKTPKTLLFDKLREQNEQSAVFVQKESDGMGAYKMKCVFDWKGEKKEIESKKFVKKRKMAEHTVALLALKFVMGLDKKEE